MRQVGSDDPGMSNQPDPAVPAADPCRPARAHHLGGAGTVVVALTVALALTGCGARLARRDATPTTTSTTASAAATSSSSTSSPNATVPTDDVEQDLDTVQSDLDGAAEDLRDGQTEATTDTRG